MLVCVCVFALSLTVLGVAPLWLGACWVGPSPPALQQTNGLENRWMGLTGRKADTECGCLPARTPYHVAPAELFCDLFKSCADAYCKVTGTVPQCQTERTDM